MRGRLAALCVAGVAVIGAGCGDDAAEEIPGVDTATVTDATDPRTDATTAAGTDRTGTDQPGDDAAPVPGAEAPPGTRTFRASRAGRIHVLRRGELLRLVAVEPSAGWRHEVTEEERDEIAVRFRRQGEEIRVEVEIEDDRLRSEVDEP